MDDEKRAELRERWGQEPGTEPADRPTVPSTLSLFLTLSVVGAAALAYFAVTELAI